MKRTQHELRMERGRVGLVAAAAIVVLSASAMAAVNPPTPIALSGTLSPAGGNYQNFTSPATINNSGQVAFSSSLSTAGLSGIFAGNPGSLQTAALKGNVAPVGGNFDGFGVPSLNSSGQIAFSATVNSVSTQGIFAGTIGSLQTAKFTGQPAPGGGNYASSSNPLFNSSGQVGFTSVLSGGPASNGIFAGAPGSVQVVALTGSPAPAGGNYVGSTGNLALNAAGQVAFRHSLTGGSSAAGIFMGAPGFLQSVALEGTPTPIGGNFTSALGLPSLNAAGTVAFHAGITTPSVPAGIFVGPPGGYQPLALSGTPAPLPALGNFATLGSTPLLNASGQVAFVSSLSSFEDGIFVGTPGFVQVVALTGTPAPGGGDFSSLSRLSLNAGGQVAFIGDLSGSGVVTGNNQGLYAGMPGLVELIIRKGDTIDVDPGIAVDSRTVNAIAIGSGSGGQDGNAIVFNDSSQLIYRLTFTDGSSGIFTSVLPEPGSLVFVSGAALLIRRRRSGRQQA